eukprot:3477245-Prymnesium_polylepis.1
MVGAESRGVLCALCKDQAPVCAHAQPAVLRIIDRQRACEPSWRRRTRAARDTRWPLSHAARSVAVFTSVLGCAGSLRSVLPALVL